MKIPQDVLVPRKLLEDLLQEDDCDYDHNGNCQGHNHFGLRYEGKLCPQLELKNLLRDTPEYPEPRWND